MSKLLSITERLIRVKNPTFSFSVFSDTPVSTLVKPLRECRLSLITTGGLHMKEDPPFDFSRQGGDTSYRTIPSSVQTKDIRISHRWYNHKPALDDINCVFPIDRVRELSAEGAIGSMADEHFSFMGHIYDTEPLLESAGKVGMRLKEIGTDIVLLTPA